MLTQLTQSRTSLRFVPAGIPPSVFLRCICPTPGAGAGESGPEGRKRPQAGGAEPVSPPRRPTDRGTREGRARAGPSWGDPPRRGAEGPRRARRGAEGGPSGPHGAAPGRAPGPSAPAGPEPGRSPARRRWGAGTAAERRAAAWRRQPEASGAGGRRSTAERRRLRRRAEAPEQRRAGASGPREGARGGGR